MEDNFASFYSAYEVMEKSYKALEDQMGDIYQNIQANGDDQYMNDLLQNLGNIAKYMISNQIEFVKNYGDPMVKDNLLDYLENREINLSKSLDDDRAKTL